MSIIVYQATQNYLTVKCPFARMDSNHHYLRYVILLACIKLSTVDRCKESDTISMETTEQVLYNDRGVLRWIATF